ncbi:hypothetical protein RintRC_6162 [Richelia intracellularis]|nr:hypothetical protein RintRC_6162 [Richelia intracellularis]
MPLWQPFGYNSEYSVETTAFQGNILQNLNPPLPSHVLGCFIAT